MCVILFTDYEDTPILGKSDEEILCGDRRYIYACEIDNVGIVLWSNRRY